MRATLLAAAALALVAGRPAAAFEPTGELMFLPRGGTGSGASFDADMVVGPAVNMVRQEGGGWAGDLDGNDVDLAVTEDHARGANVNLSFARKGGRTQIEGLFFGQRVRIELDAKKLRVRFGACSMELDRKRPGMFTGDVGCVRNRSILPATARATLRLSGDAAAEAPPMPQFALALLAILPS